jgi:hypothetical protein
MDQGEIEMREFSRSEHRDDLDEFENDQKTIRAPVSKSTSHSKRNKILTASVSPPPLRRRQKAVGDHLFIDSQSDTHMTPSFPRWLVSRSKNAVDRGSGDEYQVESWTNFHKKYSSKAYRTSNNMSFSEIRKQQRREAKPSLGERVLRRLGGQSDQCLHCKSFRCDGACSIYSSLSSQTMSSFAKKQQSLSPFNRRGPQK